jgi:hypothetical protein
LRDDLAAWLRKQPHSLTLLLLRDDQVAEANQPNSTVTAGDRASIWTMDEVLGRIAVWVAERVKNRPYSIA